MEERRRPKWQAPFFTIWTGQAFSLLGSSLVQFALVWWLTQETHSATVLATATLVALLPGAFISPIAGALVDRWNRRRVMIVADAIAALAVVALAVLFYLDVAQPWHIYVMMFIRSAAGQFHWPAMKASTSLMVPDEHLSRVEGLNQALNGFMSILAPPLGALLIGVMPLQGVLAIDVVTAALAIAPLGFIAVPQPHQAAPAGKFSLWADLREGWRYVVGWPGLLAIGIVAMALSFLLNPAFSLTPLLVTEHFKGGAFHLSGLESAMGIGMIAGGLILSVWGGFRKRVLTSLSGLIGMGVGIAFIGLAPASAFWMAVGAMFWAGVMNPITNGPLFAIVQAKVAPEMQGRAFTFMQSASTFVSPLGMVVAGPVADWLGVRVWYVAGGVACVLMGIGLFFVPVVMQLEENNNGRTVIEEGALTPAVAPVSVEAD
jgi:DHA3 family macrolide efflux protein-like MFS transporter